ncbi:MAG: VOC family protein [Hyphomicrobium sp.]
MQDGDKSIRPKLLPLIRYRNPSRSIEWLCKALGFEKHHVVTRQDGSLSYAHLSFGGSLIMVTPIGDTAADKEGTLPDKIGRPQAQSCYFVVRDVNAHYDKAKAAGAEIVLDIKVYEHGGCRYSCRDPEGHIWNFGTYDPWQPLALTYHGRQSPGRFAFEAPKRLVLAIGALMVLAGASGAAWLYGPPVQPGEIVDIAATAPAHVDQIAHLSPQSLAIDEAKKVAAVQIVRDVTPQLAPAPIATMDEGADIPTEPPVQEVTTQLAEEQSEGDTAENADVDETQEQLGKGATPLERGQKLLTKGELESARRIFRRVADKGSPEGALALGSTYDPANLARIGLAETPSDRNEAKRWYRRAHELARAKAQD